jgi:hypothetical protein
MKTFEFWGLELFVSLTQALNGGECWIMVRPGRHTPGQEVPGTY